MNNDNNPVILCEEDYKKLIDLMNFNSAPKADHEMTLAHEVARAVVVKNDVFPTDTIRINSAVRILDMETNKEKDFQLVMPSDADIKTKKVSILSPMAAAIIGFKVGDVVLWKMPSGLKKLKVVEVK